MKTAVITGVSSFVGAHLARHFSQKSWRVIATLSKPRSGYDGVSKTRLDLLENSVTWKTLDLRDEEQIKNLVREEEPDLWVHHAGWATAYPSLDYDVASGMNVNVLPLFSVYRALEKTKVAGVLVTGSGMEYSDSDEGAEETDPCFPSTPYGLCKLSETIAALQLAARYQIPTRVARLFIPYGALEAPNRLLPGLVTALLEKRGMDLSPCEQKRDFTSVEDVALAFELLAEDLLKRGGAEIFNLCSGVAIPLKLLIATVGEKLKAPPGALRFGVKPMREGEPMIAFGNNSKAKNILGWKPASLEDGVSRYLRGFL